MIKNIKRKREKMITEKKIIEVLKKYYIQKIDTRTNPIKVTYIKPEQIVDEILKESRD